MLTYLPYETETLTETLASCRAAAEIGISCNTMPLATRLTSCACILQFDSFLTLLASLISCRHFSTRCCASTNYPLLFRWHNIYIYMGYKILLSFLMYIIVETIRIERRMFFFFVLCDMKIVICFLIFNIFLLYKFKYEIV